MISSVVVVIVGFVAVAVVVVVRLFPRPRFQEKIINGKRFLHTEGSSSNMIRVDKFFRSYMFGYLLIGCVEDGQ